MAPLFRTWLTFSVVGMATVAVRPALARAADECPPGDWFCDDESPATAPPPELAPEPPDEPGGEGPAEPPPAGMLRPQMDLTAPSPDAPEQDEEGRPESPWSVSLRIQGITLGSSGDDAALGGVGASLRYALNPHLVLDLGLDSFGGTDYNGHDRTESSLAAGVLVYFNPDKAIRTYLLVGLHASAAQVDVFGDQQDWTYLGAQAGLGLDIPVHQRVSIAIDLLGFVRGRTDSRAAREPEFTDGSGNLTNTSGGGLFRGGVVLYW
ncbi:MAG: hypothetical protein RL033_4207 [Pseudomonadota bacterium]|jgi:hypothetical protein